MTGAATSAVDVHKGALGGLLAANRIVPVEPAVAALPGERGHSARARPVLVPRRPEAFGLRAARLLIVSEGAHGTCPLQLLDMRELDGRVDASLEQAGRQVLHEERPVDFSFTESRAGTSSHVGLRTAWCGLFRPISFRVLVFLSHVFTIWKNLTGYG